MKKVSGRTGKVKSLIPIGVKGELRGKQWQVIGYAHYREFQKVYTWKEYTLFNPIHGYAFLSEYDGHWSFVKTTNDYPRQPINRKTFECNDRAYSVFHSYKSKLITGAGEFDWDITTENYPLVTEFISPPYALIKETEKDQFWWYEAEHIRGKEIKKAFDIKEPMPQKQGVGSIEVSELMRLYPSFKQASIVFLVVLLILQAIFAITAKNDEVYYQSYNLADSTMKFPIITPSFTLESSPLGKANLDFWMSAPIDNDWFEADITLVNNDTDEEIYLEEGVEYYSGYEGGEHWAEGSNYNDMILSSISDGRYHMSITPILSSSAYYHSNLTTFSLRVLRDVPSWRNFWFLTLFICAIFSAYAFWISTKEGTRWINSEFNEKTYD